LSYKTCFSFLLNKTTASLRIYSLSINFTAFHKISVFRTINMHSCHRICHRGTFFLKLPVTYYVTSWWWEV